MLLELAVSVAQWPHGRTGDQSSTAEEVLLLMDEYQLAYGCILSILNLQCEHTYHYYSCLEIQPLSSEILEATN